MCLLRLKLANAINCRSAFIRQGGRNVSQLTIINQFNVLDSVLSLHSSKNSSVWKFSRTLLRVFDSFMGQFSGNLDMFRFLFFWDWCCSFFFLLNNDFIKVWMFRETWNLFGSWTKIFVITHGLSASIYSHKNGINKVSKIPFKTLTI